MQIRFCPNCDFQERDDDFEINQAIHKGIGETKCPKCDTWLWSVIFERDFVEITDWDENSIHDTKEELRKTLSKAMEIIEVEK